MNLKKIKDSTSAKRVKDAKRTFSMDEVPNEISMDIDPMDMEDNEVGYEELDNKGYDDLTFFKPDKDCFFYMGPSHYEFRLYDIQVPGYPTPAKLKAGKSL